ncbi:hypothetical protein A9Q99_20390 [Gammaproteobacteria bacterium 45_16_T64]|nr:hypothetical protein A9Q99_20390 [Gammaproteobacteria bacterium 45_16_T64]
MSTLDALKTNLNVAKTLIVDGRDRYLGVTKAAIAIEQIYRQQRNKAKLLSEQSASSLLSEAHTESAELICNLCKENGAIWVKFGQFLSCRPDILPLEYLPILQKLQNEATPAPFEKIHPAIVEAWGDDWDRHFLHFDIIPIATASIAQVHKATLRNGMVVAVKIQLPDVVKLFEQDSLVFRSVAGVIAPLVKEIDIRQVTDQLIKMTMKELDFRVEAENLRVFSEHEHADGIRVPALWGELSGEKIMVTEWIDGAGLTSYLEEQPSRAKDILNRLLSSYIQQITQFGSYHADPHPGNFLVDEHSNIAILDYGALASLSEDETLKYSKLLFGLMGLNSMKLGELFSEAGFTCERQEALEEISEHFLEEEIKDRSVSDRLAHVLELLRENRVTIPDSFIAMARVIISIGGFMKQYEVDFEWMPSLIKHNIN